MLRFLGYVKNTYPPCELDFGIFRSADPPALKIMQEFTDWLVDIRKVSYGTIAGPGTLHTASAYARVLFNRCGRVLQFPSEPGTIRKHCGA